MIAIQDWGDYMMNVLLGLLFLNSVAFGIRIAERRIRGRR